jgi:hypothetical protein
MAQVYGHGPSVLGPVGALMLLYYLAESMAMMAGKDPLAKISPDESKHAPMFRGCPDSGIWDRSIVGFASKFGVVLVLADADVGGRASVAERFADLMRARAVWNIAG